MYQLSAKLAQNYQVTALVVGLSVWKLSCTIWSCPLYTVNPIHLFTFVIVGGGVMPDPLGYFMEHYLGVGGWYYNWGFNPQPPPPRQFSPCPSL